MLIIVTGDEIIEINGVNLSEMSYVEAVELLRDSPIKSQLLIRKNHNNQEDINLLMNNPSNCIPSYDLTPISVKQSVTESTNNYNNNTQFGSTNPNMVMARKQLFPEDPIPQLNHPSDILKYSSESNTFVVTLLKNMRGLGLSIIGGVDCGCNSNNNNNNNNNLVSSSSQSLPSTPSVNQLMSSSSSSSLLFSNSSSLLSPPPSPVDKLIRIKRVFPSDPASNAGLIPGDIILEANGTSTIGMTQVVRIS